MPAVEHRDERDVIAGGIDLFDRAIERFLSLARLGGLSPAEARDQLRERPIVGPLEHREPWWAKPLRKLTVRRDPDDDVSRFREP